MNKNIELFTSLHAYLLSGFHEHHSTKNALNKVFNDIYMNTEYGRTTVLILLDLRAAFDEVNYDILLK